VTLGAQDAREGVAHRGRPRVDDDQGPRGIGRDEFDIDPLAAAKVDLEFFLLTNRKKYRISRSPVGPSWMDNRSMCAILPVPETSSNLAAS
jgi:hypothetical protein